MKKVFIFLFFAGCSIVAMAQENCPVIPAPLKSVRIAQEFRLTPTTAILVSPSKFRKVASYFKEELGRTCSLSLPSAGSGTKIILRENIGADVAAESYQLKMNADSVVISARHEKGMFYGLISLLQLIRQSKPKHSEISVPCWNISDAPIYAWRGLMLDESRAFYGKQKLKSILNWMAFYKLNKFHWHLTDEPGWRLEIKKYPRLTTVGGIGNFLNDTAAATYYTQEDIRELVAYASDRQIEVIPEIDMPGHATAANHAYPEYSGGGSAAHPDFTFNPGKEGTYQYLSDILHETSQLFPSKMMHIGGDEVSFGNQQWPYDADVKNLMRSNNLKDLIAVEKYFMQRMSDTVLRSGSKVLAWDEMVDAGLPKNQSIIFWWRHDQPQQLKHALDKGYTTVLCPRIPMYFDFVQDSLHQSGRKWQKQFSPLEMVYLFAVDQLPVAANQRKFITGVQANIWTETMPTAKRLDFMLFPRISALAEAAWSEPASRNYAEYLNRLKTNFPWYEQEGIYYYDPLHPNLHPEPISPKKPITGEKSLKNK